MKRLPARNIIIIIAFLVVAIGAIALVFSNAMSSYRSNMALASAAHLSEIDSQIVRSIGENIEDKWEDAAVLEDELESGEVGNVEELLPILQKTVKIRAYANIYVYTESGRCYDSTGGSMNVDEADEMVYRAQQSGRSIQVVKSMVYYTVPVDTTIAIDGSRIVGLSVVEDTRDTLDRMDIQSFNGQAIVYLAQGNGLIISRTSNANQSIISIDSLYSGDTTKMLSGQYDTIGEALAAQATGAFMHADDGAREYAVTMTVPGVENDWGIILIAPESVVNQSSSDYTAYLSRLSVIMIVAIALILTAVLYYLFRERIKNLDEVASREQMLNLLITNTKSVFALYSTHQPEPLFESANAKEVLGAGYRSTIDVTGSDGKPRFAPVGSDADECISELNDELSRWDGTGEFVSGYLPIEVNEARRYIAVRIYPSQNADEYVAMTQDVTQERDRENTLRAALSAADSANQAKSTFLSNMSHDIRTPMNAIVNMTDFALQSARGDEQLTQYLSTIKTSSDHLLHLINEVLDMSRIESGKTIVDQCPFDLRKKLGEVEDIIRPICDRKKQTLVCDYAIHHDVLGGDAMKLGQVLINLLNNAAKFTDENGRIELTVAETVTLRSGTAVYRFEVTDNGIGIEQVDIERIFAPFSRAANAVGIKAEGTGLGLSICRSYIDMMNGDISVKSTPGVGSTFTVELPFYVEIASAVSCADRTAGGAALRANRVSGIATCALDADSDARALTTAPAAPAAASPAPAAPPATAAFPAATMAPASPATVAPPAAAAPEFDGMRALLVEDNEINCQIACMLLGKLGFSIVSAENGAEAVKLVEESPVETFDIVFMDIQMPVMNGYEATRAIRSSERQDARALPVVAMTANVFAEDVEKAREAGMNAHVGKPIMLQEVVEAVRSALDKGDEDANRRES